MVSLTSQVENRIGRNFIIFHPSDFSPASEVAFAHALKIALKSKAKLDLMHVGRSLRPEKLYWLDFPAVRATLARWGILPEGVRREEVAQTGLRVRKILKASIDPVETMLRHFRTFPPDMIVLATHQRGGLARWLRKAVAEPLARRSGAMTLFVPRTGRGFVSLEDGTVALHRILIPIDHIPRPQTALRRALLLARGLGCVAGEFRLIHVGNPGTAPKINLPEEAGWSYEIIVRQGDVVDQIHEEEAHWRPDLMVLATQGHMDFLDALRGSTTERVLRAAQCPVLAIPARNRSRR
ncbi:MAG TPA: universal stress protein [Candidatus Binatia bacterium]|nr:universal stress protein [Candidatus Binatia bacterium]